MVMRNIRVSDSAVRRIWGDPELTLPQAAQALGMHVSTLQLRAQAMKLPPRRTGRREVIRPRQEAEFRAMWLLGVSAREIGLHFGCSYFATINTAQRLGLTMRGAGYRPERSLNEYRQERLAAQMRMSQLDAESRK